MRRYTPPPNDDPGLLCYRLRVDGIVRAISSHLNWQLWHPANAHAGVELQWRVIDEGDQYCRAIRTAMYADVVYRVEEVRRHPLPPPGEYFGMEYLKP